MQEQKALDIDVDAIMHRIRMEVSRRKNLEKAEPREPCLTAAISPDGMKLQHVRLAKAISEPAIEPKDVYHVNEFLAFHDAAFIVNAYRGVLKRGADASGLDHYLKGLRDGSLSKIEILGRLRYSEEGRSRKVRIKGLLLPLGVEVLRKLPVVGYLIGVLSGVLNLPTIVKKMRAFEAFSNHRLSECNQRILEASSAVELSLNRVIDSVSACAPLKDLLELREEYSRALGALARADALESMRSDFVLDLEQKADKSEIEALRSELSARPSAGELERFQAVVLGDLRGLRAEILEIGRSIRDHRIQLLDQERRLALLLKEARKRLPEPLSGKQVERMLTEEDHLLDAMYVSFEDRFRGTREDIKRRQAVYLPTVSRIRAGSSDAPILDIGCGRGEWLELCKERGLHCRGIDLNRVMVEQCRELGLEAVEGDALEALRSRKPQSFGLITAFHLVEHLDLKTLIGLFDESLRALRPGGAVIFETPNPDNLLTASRNFYMDPSHRNPLPSQLLKYLAEARGFVDVEILNLHPVADYDRAEDVAGSLASLLYGPQDYGLVGYKA